MTEPVRYAAFISYSSRDERFAQRLHKALERYRIPNSLGKFALAGESGKANHVYPVFRDREEGSAGHLGDRLEAALSASAALIVVCSPNAAASSWVQKEIEFFVGLGRADRIFAVIPDNAPLYDDAGLDATPTCFPPALRGDALTAAGALEPLAADARKGKDGFRNAWLKIVGGLIGVTPGQIINRDARARRQRTLQAAAIWALVAIGAGIAYVHRKDIEPQVISYALYKPFAHGPSKLQAVPDGATFQDCFENTTNCPVMVIVPAGEFMMGDPRYGTYKVSIIRFAASQTEITFDDWDLCARRGGCETNPYPPDNEHWGREKHPVVNISWDNATDYAEWLSRMTGASYRLLSEEEWEYAARGFTSADAPSQKWGFGDDKNLLKEYARYRENTDLNTQNVKTRKPNRFGLYDMHGNAWEWVQGCFEPKLHGMEFCARTLRGGSAGYGPTGLRSAERRWARQTTMQNMYGFRIARDLVPRDPQSLLADVDRIHYPVTPDRAHETILTLDEKLIAGFLARGWSPNAQMDRDSNTPLHILMEVCQKEPEHDKEKLVRIARLLLDTGAEPSWENKWYETPVFLASVQKYCGLGHPVVAVMEAAAKDIERQLPRR